MTEMTAAYFDGKQASSNQLNSPLLDNNPGTAVHVPGAQGGLPKISAKNLCLKKPIGATTLLLYKCYVRFG
jgi:hypothetical protein